MSMQWVDFKAVKAAVSMELALSRYQVNWLRKKDDELRGRCPIHQGEGTDTFHVSLKKNAFQCFSCKARGNVLDFVAAMEKCSVRDAGIKLQEWFSVTSPETTASVPPPAAPQSSGGEGTVAENKPLTFQLKGVDSEHPYLADRGISKETTQAFGVGLFSGKGSMRARLVIPIHNERGELVAYAGRAIDGSEPRYKLPAGFHKSQVLFNLHRITDAREVVLVEGFFDCMKLWQANIAAVALMGCSLSVEQERLLVDRFKVVILMFDGDEAGRQATDECLLRLGRKTWVKAISLPSGMQPDQLSDEQLRGLWEK